MDVLRELYVDLENGDLKDMVDELITYTAEFSYRPKEDLGTVLNDEEMK